ncbi:MAG: NAD(P)-binding domain-containing protein [Acetobacteraceae bacterium]|nr:NAD(P)-binding domain-containing protein [Acetobacteraceae bacterium]
MNLAIIGSGNVGGALAGALRRAGHQVVFGVRDPQPGKPDETTVAGSAKSADVVILAVPFTAARDVIASASGFAGKVLIDATNPLGMKEDGLGLTVGFDTSGAEQVAAMAPQAQVFKAFNQTGFENMADARRYTARPVMFVAGDGNRKPAVLSLVGEAGFEAIDLGGLRTARLLEPFAMLWIELARKRGLGSDFVFTLQRTASKD